MSSPKNFVFTVLDATTGSPKSGLSLSFTTYRDDAGTNVSPPTITNIAGSTGGYQFTPVFPANHGIYFEISTTQAPSWISGYLDPRDYALDDIAGLSTTLDTLLAIAGGTWIIQTSGPDANRLVYYDDDDNVVAKFDLQLTGGGAWVPPAGANTRRIKVA